jgi:uracil-DNA glycosylase
MPFNEDQATFLHELGVKWVRPTKMAATEATAELRTPAPAPANPPSVALPVARPGVPAARAADPVTLNPAIASAGWAELEAAVAGCQACGLCATRTQTVFGVGSTQAQWLVVGEAPGEQEDLKGEPFVGAAGRLLDQMLQALHLTRALPAPGATLLPAQQVYIANTLKCRPPGNRNPQAEELLQCEPYLQRQLQLLQPRIILAMGRFAVQSLLRSSEPIGKLRGQVHRYQGVPLVVTYHPAYLLRNPLDKAKAWADLCLAADTFDQAAALDDTQRAT